MRNTDWKWTLSRLKPQDWDFRREKLTEGDRWGCFVYEFSREDEALRSAVADSRKRYPDYTKRYGQPEGQRTMAETLTQPVLPLAYTTHPDWPQVPFLSLPKMPIKPIPPNPSEGCSFYGVRPWTLDRLIRAFVRKEAYPGELRPQDWEESPSGGLWRYSEQSDLVAFEIPWHWPDDTLKRGFAQWLKEHRPARKPGDWRPKVEQTKKLVGAAAPRRQYLASLKALGAYRLLLCYGGDRQQARGHKNASTVLGKDFDNDSAWTAARQRAEQTIASIKDLNKSAIENEQFVGTTVLSSLLLKVG